MTDKTSHNKKGNNESADNMSQNEQFDGASVGEENMDHSAHAEEPVENAGSELEKLQAELAEMKDKHLRLVAEFDNFRRRNAKERVELTQTAGKEIIESLLVVLDDMDRASKQLENSTDIAVLKEGTSLVFNKLKKVLQAKGLKEMEVGHGEFNPDLHEAITEIPAPKESMVGKVIDVVEAGYYLNDKLIRHAKVVVGK